MQTNGILKSLNAVFILTLFVIMHNSNICKMQIATIYYFDHHLALYTVIVIYSLRVLDVFQYSLSRV